MSTREPLWYCHECHAEMRPLMVPDPVCASCHGSFVEKMENAADDPRQFGAGEPGLLDDGMGGLGDALGPAALLFSLQSLMDRGMRDRGAGGGGTGPSVTFEVRGPSGSRTMHFGRGANTARNTGTNSTPGSPGRNNEPPNMSTFLGNPFGLPMPMPTPPGGGDRPNISGPLMANYLMALLGHAEPGGMFGMPENGRMGDYVFNQEALDHIISQIMENSNAHRPVAAPEDVIAKLPREVLEQGSPMLDRDCAVCKDQFKLDTEDPDEQIVVTLPCKHPFHQPCITPWLTSSGTCPVCRFALVPQPDQHGSQSPPPQSSGSANESRPNPTSPGQSSSNTNTTSNTSRGADGGANRSGGGQGSPGFIQSIFSNLMGLAHPQQQTPDSTTSGIGENNNRSGSSRHSRNNSYGDSSSSSGARGSGGNPSSPPRDRPRSPPAQRSPDSSRWGGTDYTASSSFRRSPLHSPFQSSTTSPTSRAHAASPSSSPTFASRFRPASPPNRDLPPLRRDSDQARGSSAPPGSPGSAAQRRRDQHNDGHNSLPGSWSDELD